MPNPLLFDDDMQYRSSSSDDEDNETMNVDSIYEYLIDHGNIDSFLLDEILALSESDFDSLMFEHSYGLPENSNLLHFAGSIGDWTGYLSLLEQLNKRSMLKDAIRLNGDEDYDDFVEEDDSESFTPGSTAFSYLMRHIDDFATVPRGTSVDPQAFFCRLLDILPSHNKRKI